MRVSDCWRRPTSPPAPRCWAPRGAASRALTTTRNPASSGSSATTALPMHLRASTPRAGRPRSSPHSRPTSRASSRCSPSKASHFHRPVNALTQTPRCPTQKPFAGTRAASACGGRARATGHAAASPACANPWPPGNGRAIFRCQRPSPPSCSPSAPARASTPAWKGWPFLTTAAPPGWRWKWPGYKMAPAPPCRPLVGPCASPHWTWPQARHSSSGPTPRTPFPARAVCPGAPKSTA